ncbi:AVL9/DENND6 domain-containing protein [Entamoeba marina]
MEEDIFLHLCLIQKETSKMLILPPLPSSFNYNIKDLAFLSCTDTANQPQIHFHPSRNPYDEPLRVISSSLNTKHSLALLTNSPYLHYFISKVACISNFLSLHQAIPKPLLIQAYNLLVTSSRPHPTPRELQTSFNITSCLTTLLQSTTTSFTSLIKLLLLEQKVVYLSTTKSSSALLYSLCCTIPGLVIPFNDVLVANNVEVINPLLELALPLNIFSFETLLFSLPLVALGKITGAHTFTAAVCSNALRTKSKQIDLIIDIDNKKLSWNSSDLQKIVSPTSADKKFTSYLLDCVKTHKENGGYQGSEHWLLMNCTKYVVELLATLCSYEIFDQNPINEYIPKRCDYGYDFIMSFGETQIFKDWKRTLTLSGKAKKMTEIFNACHPMRSIKQGIISKSVGNDVIVYDYEQLFSEDQLAKVNGIESKQIQKEIHLSGDDVIDL